MAHRLINTAHGWARTGGKLEENNGRIAGELEGNWMGDWRRTGGELAENQRKTGRELEGNWMRTGGELAGNWMEEN